MTEPESQATPDEALLQSVWAEARDLVRKLEGSSVQRFSVAAGNCKIEIERGAPASAPATIAVQPPAASAAAAPAAADDVAAAPDSRHAIVAPLVGTFYRAPQPGAKPFVEEGDVVAHQGVPYAPFGVELNREWQRPGLSESEIKEPYEEPIETHKLYTKDEAENVLADMGK